VVNVISILMSKMTSELIKVDSIHLNRKLIISLEDNMCHNI